jgi:hypothetical protein
MWYGSDGGGLGHMFVDPRHIPNEMESNDDGENEHFKGDQGIMDFDRLMTMKHNDLFMGGVVRSSEIRNS